MPLKAFKLDKLFNFRQILFHISVWIEGMKGGGKPQPCLATLSLSKEWDWRECEMGY